MQMQQPISVLHFSTADNEGGSGRAAYRIHSGLREQGLRSRMLVGQKTTSDPDVDTVQGGRLGRALDLAAAEAGARTGLQYLYVPSSHRVTRHPWVREADVFQLYNTHGGYFSQTLLPFLSKRGPVVWRLSDLWPLTGHCAYPGTCTRWQTGCGACPSLSAYPAIGPDTTALLFQVKRWLYRRSDITVVAPSRWTERLARESPLLGRFPVRRIPNGIDLSVFRPLDRRLAREFLGLDPEQRMILFAANVLDDNPRKGGPQLLEALRQLDLGEDTTLLLAGVGGTSWEGQATIRVHSLGYIRDDRLLAAAYASADIIACPALEENLPNSALEAMACGTPAVVFDTGGVGDAVEHMRTGYVARHGDTADLAAGLGLLLADASLRATMGTNARRLMEREFDKQLQAERFAALYGEVLHERAAARGGRERG